MKKYLIIDVETANGLEQPLVYDIGVAIIDKKAKVYEKRSMIIKEIFYYGFSQLMESAYYAEKVAQYDKDIENGTHGVVKFFTAYKYISYLAKKWNVKGIIAHNSFFDYNALNTTLRYLSGSKYRYFLPFGIPILDTLTMARNSITHLKEYTDFCDKLPEVRKVKGKNRLTAEILYQFISNNENFIEEHTGLADVMIEKEIFRYALEVNPTVRKNLFNERVFLPMTKIQRRIHRMIRGF